MKKSLLLSVALVMGQFLCAQFVTIPDTAFVSWLQTNYPTCMVGPNMDTTCPGILNAPNLFLSGINAADLSGVQYFDNATLLWAPDNQISFIPALPPNLTQVNFGNNQLDSLPSLPATLNNLSVYNNNLQTLPSLPSEVTNISANGNQISILPSLPDKIRLLILSDNQVSSLPPLPDSLRILLIGDNDLIQLPQLPPFLEQLTAPRNQLMSLPTLPNGLSQLAVPDNQISGIPTGGLPDSLLSLEVQGNPILFIPGFPAKLQLAEVNRTSISALPSLPPTLQLLDFSETSVSSLPPVPNSLRTLQMNRTQVSVLPLLPDSLLVLEAGNGILNALVNLSENLGVIELDSNNIACFPPFPDSAIALELIGNPMTCLPNYVGAMSQDLLNLPLCLNNDPVNNPSGCIAGSGVYGQFFEDLDQDCLLSNGDQLLANIPIERVDLAGNLLEITYSQANGLYHFPLDSGDFRIRIDTASQPFSTSCFLPGPNVTISLGSSSSLFQVDFPLENAVGYDLQALGIVPRGIIFPGQPFDLEIYAGLISSYLQFLPTNTLSGQVQVVVEGPVSYDTTLVDALIPTVNGDTFTYPISDFSTLNWMDDLGLVFSTDTTATIGDSVCVHVLVSPMLGDNDPSNNERDFCFAVGNSFDPNDKLVYPAQVLPGFNDDLTYTIRFQNTGTAPAFNIVLRDTLSSLLDPSTFQFVASSHNCQVSLQENRLSALFSNIQLPDSLSDPEGSQGFVQFRVKPIPGLPIGTQINNRAGIYFDYNAPIITDFAVTTYGLQVFAAQPAFSTSEILISPNPSAGEFSLVFEDHVPTKTFSIEVYNVLGQVVQRRSFRPAEQIEFDLGRLGSGVYLLHGTEPRTWVKKVVVD